MGDAVRGWKIGNVKQVQYIYRTFLSTIQFAHGGFVNWAAGSLRVK